MRTLKFEASYLFWLAFLVLNTDVSAPNTHPNKSGFRLLFGSCNTARMSQWVWGPVSNRNPDAWLWLGDTVYGDLNSTEFTTLRSKWQAATPELLRHLYHMQRNHPDYSRFVEEGTEIYGVWDDHDFGDDNADSTYPYKIESQEAFLDFLGEDPESPRRSQEGVYSTHLLDNGRIRLILLDVRYHRTPYSVGADGDFLGETQWQWLESVLRSSRARVNVIAGGIQFLAPRTSVLGVPLAESWSRFPRARDRLFNLILSSGVRAPLLLSGDVHFAEISEGVCTSEDSDGNSRKLVEVTSSGMTHSWGSEGWFLLGLLNIFLSIPGNNAYQKDGLIYKGMNFGELEFRLVIRLYKTHIIISFVTVDRIQASYI